MGVRALQDRAVQHAGAVRSAMYCARPVSFSMLSSFGTAAPTVADSQVDGMRSSAALLPCRLAAAACTACDDLA